MKYIKVYDRNLPVEICDNLIHNFENNCAPLHDPIEGHRDFNEVNIMKEPSMSELAPLLVDYAVEAVRRYIFDCDINRVDFPTDMAMEEFRMKRYDPGSVGFTHHVDANNLESSKRYLVFFWYLNDVSRGGGTEFVGRDIKITPQQGRLIMFPPLWTYPHAGMPLFEEPKYIVGGYLNYV